MLISRNPTPLHALTLSNVVAASYRAQPDVAVPERLDTVADDTAPGQLSLETLSVPAR